MVAVANASHLSFPEKGLKYHAVSINDISKTIIPKINGHLENLIKLK